MSYRKNVAVLIFVLFFTLTIGPLLSYVCKADSRPPTVKLNIDPFSIIYKGDIIDCRVLLLASISNLLDNYYLTFIGPIFIKNVI